MVSLLKDEVTCDVVTLNEGVTSDVVTLNVGVTSCDVLSVLND